MRAATKGRSRNSICAARQAPLRPHRRSRRPLSAARFRSMIDLRPRARIRAASKARSRNSICAAGQARLSPHRRGRRSLSAARFRPMIDLGPHARIRAAATARSRSSICAARQARLSPYRRSRRPLTAGRFRPAIDLRRRAPIRIASKAHSLRSICAAGPGRRLPILCGSPLLRASRRDPMSRPRRSVRRSPATSVRSRPSICGTHLRARKPLPRRARISSHPHRTKSRRQLTSVVIERRQRLSFLGMHPMRRFRRRAGTMRDRLQRGRNRSLRSAQPAPMRRSSLQKTDSLRRNRKHRRVLSPSERDPTAMRRRLSPRNLEKSEAWRPSQPAPHSRRYRRRISSERLQKAPGSTIRRRWLRIS